jgi:CBS domain-containing protein
VSELFSQKDIAAQFQSLDTLEIVPPTTPIPDALQQMQHTKASCVLVVENQKLLGIFTERDVVRTLATRSDRSSLPISARMSTQVITLSETEAKDLAIVLQCFRRYRIRHLPIVNAAGLLVGVATPESVRQAMGVAGELKGIVTQSSILQALDPIKLAEAIQSLQQLVEQKEQAFQHELNYRKQIERDLEKINQTMHQIIKQSVLQQTQYLQDEIETLHERNQKLERDLQHYITVELNLEQLRKNRYLHRITHELNLSLSNIEMAIQMLEIVLKQMGAFGKRFPLLDPYFQILKNECESGIQVMQELVKSEDEKRG